MSIKITKKILVFLLVLGCMIFPSKELKAESIGDIVDGSYLTNEREVEAVAKSLTRGADLQLGTSKLTILGEGKIAIIGITFAQRVVKDIGVEVELQMIGSGGWETVESWKETDHNIEAVQVSKTVEVKPGYYRLYTHHTANSDESYSITDAIFID